MILFSCRRAAELCSRELAVRLKVPERLGLTGHLLMCQACRRFRVQVREIDRQVGEYVGGADGGTETLPPDTKAEMKRTLKPEAEGGSPAGL